MMHGFVLFLDVYANVFVYVKFLDPPSLHLRVLLHSGHSCQLSPPSEERFVKEW